MLATLRTIEEYPDGEIRCELLKTVLVPGGHKDECPTSDRMSRSAVDEHTFASRYHIDLVAPMRLLAVAAAGRVELRCERAVPKDGHSEISGRRLAADECCLKVHHDGVARLSQDGPRIQWPTGQRYRPQQRPA